MIPSAARKSPVRAEHRTATQLGCPERMEYSVAAGSRVWAAPHHCQPSKCMRLLPSALPRPPGKGELPRLSLHLVRPANLGANIWTRRAPWMPVDPASSGRSAVQVRGCLRAGAQHPHVMS